MDITWTRDRVPIVLHDETLDRTTDGQGPAVEAAWADTRGLDAGSWFSHSFAGLAVPTLQEVLEKYGNRTFLHLELKPETYEPLQGSRPPGTQQGAKNLVQRVIDSAREPGLLDLVALSSFDWRILKQARDHAEEVSLGVLQHRGDPLLALEVAVDLQADALHLNRHLVTTKLVEKAHAKGLGVRVYTVDSPKIAERYRSWGVDAVFSNRTGLLREHLAQTT